MNSRRIIHGVDRYSIMHAETVFSKIHQELPEEYSEPQVMGFLNNKDIVALHGCNGLTILDLLTKGFFDPKRAVKDKEYGSWFSVTANPDFGGWGRGELSKVGPFNEYSVEDCLKTSLYYADLATSSDANDSEQYSELAQNGFVIAFGSVALEGASLRVMPGTAVEGELEHIPELVFRKAPDIESIASIHSVGPISAAMNEVIEAGMPKQNPL